LMPKRGGFGPGGIASVGSPISGKVLNS